MNTKKTTSKTTPGPWRATGGVWPDMARHWVEGGGYRVAQGPDVMPEPMAYANAALIAAAPDLLASLEEIVSTRPTQGRYARARAAIAKARGVTR